MTATAEIIPFPTVEQPKLSCTDCQNVYMGTRGLFCGVYTEIIVFDDVANECPEYEPF